MVLLLFKTVLWFFKKLKIELPYNWANSLLAVYPKDLKRGIWTDIFDMHAHRNIIHIGKNVETMQMFINGWISKMLYIHIMEYYLAL